MKTYKTIHKEFYTKEVRVSLDGKRMEYVLLDDTKTILYLDAQLTYGQNILKHENSLTLASLTDNTRDIISWYTGVTKIWKCMDKEYFEKII